MTIFFRQVVLASLAFLAAQYIRGEVPIHVGYAAATLLPFFAWIYLWPTVFRFQRPSLYDVAEWGALGTLLLAIAVGFAGVVRIPVVSMIPLIILLVLSGRMGIHAHLGRINFDVLRYAIRVLFSSCAYIFLLSTCIAGHTVGICVGVVLAILLSPAEPIRRIVLILVFEVVPLFTACVVQFWPQNTQLRLVGILGMIFFGAVLGWGTATRHILSLCKEAEEIGATGETEAET